MTDGTDLKLDNGSRVAVLGGGPAGTFFSYFLLAMAERIGLDIEVDIYESRNFSNLGPTGCNMCGGIVSESLVQALASEGMDLPPDVVQRGIDSYFLHMDVGSVKIETPLHEKRIAAVFRGRGPKGSQNDDWRSFDGYLLNMAQEKGAHLMVERVTEVFIEDKGKPQIKTKRGHSQVYDLLTVAVGVNSPALKLFTDMGIGYKPPGTTKTFICEFQLGEEKIGQHLGSSMHTFLLSIPRLEFAAIVPKGNYATACMLGYKIDKDLVNAFFSAQAVKKNFPADWESAENACQCSPRMNISAADPPFFDRLVFIGDSGVSRLYKDGIGAAYRTSKAAARTVVFEGVSKEDFRNHYWPICKSIKNDNFLGKLTFMIVGLLKKVRFARRAILRMVSLEQSKEGSRLRMSTVLWDMFTGSAPYKEVFFRTLHPFFLSKFMWNVAVALWPFKNRPSKGEAS